MRIGRGVITNPPKVLANQLQLQIIQVSSAAWEGHYNIF